MDKNKKLFPQRLWELIHDEKYNFCLRWSPDGQRVYLNRNEFENHYLKTPSNQFHTQKAISFVRQMNMYGFRKVDDCYYENDNFKRNCYHLLKNMVRRHSNKAFYSSNNLESQNNHSHSNSRTSPISVLQHDQSTPAVTTTASANAISQHLYLQQRNQSYHQQINDATAARAAAINVERQTSATAVAAAAAAAAAAAQCLRDAGGSVGNIGAALAAMNSSTAAASLAQAPTTRSPLASTLYHRLAALNFDQSNQANEHFLQQRRTSSMNTATLTNTNATSLIQEKVGTVNQDIQGHNSTSSSRILSHRTTLSNQQQQLELLDIQMNTQHEQSLAARQANQDLVRSFLQLKQPQVPLAIQHNLIASLQQHNPNLLLESLASLSTANQLAQLSQSSSSASVGSMSPLELVVNPIPSSTSELGHRHQSNKFQQQNFTTMNDNINPLMNLTKRSNNNMARDAFNGSCSFYDNHIDDDENEIDQGDEDECMTEFKDGLFAGRNNALSGNISSSSSNNNDSSRGCAQDPEDTTNAVLNLAKPSSTRSNGCQRTSRKSD